MSNFENGYALSIGIADYKNIPSLPNGVVNDARDTVKILVDPLHCGYLSKNIRLLTNEEATYQRIVDSFDWLASVTEAVSTVVIFFSGHGGQSTGKSNYLLPHDFDNRDLEGTAIDSAKLSSMVNAIPADRVLLVFDACHSGGIGDLKRLAEDVILKSGVSEDMYEELAQGTGRAIMAACRENEQSIILSSMTNSVFTHYFLEALRGSGTSESEQVIPVFDIFNYVSRQVINRVKKQHPIFKSHLEDNFPIALNRRGKSANLDFVQAGLREKSTVRDSKKLRQVICRVLNLEELEVLCSDIEAAMRNDGLDITVSLEVVGGSSKETKVTRLIDYLNRRDKIQYLVDGLRSIRPEIEEELNSI